MGIDDGLSLLARFAADGHGNDGVGISAQRHGRVALPVVRQAGMRPPAALHEEVVREIDGWVAQIHVALELQDGRSRRVFRGVGLSGFHGRLRFCDTCEERGGIAVGLRILFGVGADGARHRLGVEPLERFACKHRLVVNGRRRRGRRRRFRGVHLCHRLPGEFRAFVLHEVHGQHKRTRVDERLAAHDPAVLVQQEHLHAVGAVAEILAVVEHDLVHRDARAEIDLPPLRLLLLALVGVRDGPRAPVVVRVAIHRALRDAARAEAALRRALALRHVASAGVNLQLRDRQHGRDARQAHMDVPSLRRRRQNDARSHDRAKRKTLFI